MSKVPIATMCGLVFGPAGITFAVLAIRDFVGGDFLRAIVGAAFAMFCLGLVVPFFKLVPGRISPRVTCDDGGTTFRPDRAVDIPVQLSLVGLVIGGGLFAIFEPLGALDVPVPREMRYYLPFLGAIIAVVGVPICLRTLRRRGSKYIRLTADGFEFVQGWRSQSGDWSAVEDINDEVPGQSTATPGAIVVVSGQGQTASITASSFTPDGSAMRELVRHYWRHPEHRPELVDGQVSQRLSTCLDQA